MYVVSTGMICPVGLTAASACTAMQAGIAMFEELPYCDNSGEPIIGAVIPGLAPNLKREDRLIELLSAALVDCLNKGSPEPSDMIPLLVGLAEPGRPGGGAALADRVVGLMEQKLNRKFHPKLSRVIPSGHTAGFEALAIARDLLRDRQVPACIVCSVDSYINASSLLWLDQHWRLKTEENSDGVIPGEAAAAVMVCAQQNTSATSMRIIGLGFGNESATVLTEEPLLGLGLTEASKGALSEAGIQMHQVGFRLSDVTGESYGFKEQALTLSRVMRIRKEEFPIWHCAEFIGDAGAVAGVCQLVVADQVFKNGYSSGDSSICYTSSISGSRAVAVVETTAPSIVECRGNR